MARPARILACAFALLAIAALPACSAQQRIESPVPSPTPAATSTEPSGIPSPSVIATDQSKATSSAPLTAAKAWAIVQAKCVVCHTLDRVDKAKLDWKGWATAVEHMQQNGAKLTPQEKQAVSDYLASRK